ncbi:hypothetical protein BGZ60DRAFT_424204, partial [Tricladium varicosporioides]
LQEDPWSLDWNSRFEQLLIELRQQKAPLYSNLLVQYATALIPRTEDDLDDKRSLHFMSLRRVRILDLQVQLRDYTNYMCFGRFGQRFKPCDLEKIYEIVKEYDEAMDSYERAGNILYPGAPWRYQLIHEHSLLLQMFEDKESRTEKVGRRLHRIVRNYTSQSGRKFSTPGIIWFISEFIRGLSEEKLKPGREGDLLWLLGEEFMYIFSKIVSAVSGGLAITIPILIMSFNPSKTKNLVTTSIFVFVFAVLLAFSRHQSRGELLAGTAAYAAVLVVFVGTSNAN